MSTETGKQRLVAIDQDILLGLSVSLDPHKRAFDFFFRSNYLPLVTPCVWSVVQDVREKSKDLDARRQAQIIIHDTLDSLTVTPDINETYRQSLDIHAERLLEKGVLKGGNKVDALTVLEAVFLDASVLLTINPVLKQADKDGLKLALIECGLRGLHIVSPKQITDYLDLQAAVHKHAKVLVGSAA